MERQLRQAAPAAPAAVAGRAPARRGVPAGDQARRRGLPGTAGRRARAARLRDRRSTARRRGTGWPSSRGWGSTTWSPGSRAAPASRTPRRGRCRPRAAGFASPRCTCPTAASPTPTTTTTSSSGSARCAAMVAAGPEAAIVAGDMNIAPTDEDVFDPEAYVGETHVTAPEREALAELQSLGLHDVVRDRWPDRAGVHLLGLPGRDVSPGPGDAHRPRAGQRPRWPTGSRRRGWTARRARARVPAITPP